MKKVTLLLCFILPLLLCGCNEQHSPQEQVKFYYPRAQISYGKADSAFSYELRERAALQPEELLSLYLQGPITDSFSQPFPRNISIIQLHINEQEAALVLSDEYASLSDLALSVANASLFRTVTELTNADSVRISCLSKSLDGEKEITLTKQSVIFYDQSIATKFENDETTPSIR